MPIDQVNMGREGHLHAGIAAKMPLTAGTRVEDIETLVGEKGKTTETPRHEEQEETQNHTGAED